MITITPIVAYTLFALGFLVGAIASGIVACISVIRSLKEEK